MSTIHSNGDSKEKFQKSHLNVWLSCKGVFWTEVSFCELSDSVDFLSANPLPPSLSAPKTASLLQPCRWLTPSSQNTEGLWRACAMHMHFFGLHVSLAVFVWHSSFTLQTLHGILWAVRNLRNHSIVAHDVGNNSGESQIWLSYRVFSLDRKDTIWTLNWIEKYM